MAVGLLSLSSVSLRESAASGSSTAEDNARLALYEAINELQKTTGPDTRITAPADAVAGGSLTAPRQLTGVWRSWEGSDHDQDGQPTVPIYNNKLVNGDLIDANQPGRFLTWLVSSYDRTNRTPSDASAPPSVVAGADTVPLLSAGSVSVPAEEVHVIPKNTQDGQYAWWIQGQNTKALIEYDDADFATLTVEENSERFASNALPHRESFNIPNELNLDNVLTVNTIDLITDSKPYFNDLTTYSKGLLTNNATGGWKKDLSVMSENWATVESNGEIDSFNLTYEGDTLTRSIGYGLAALNQKTTGNNITNANEYADNNADIQASIYGWATDRHVSMSWNALVEFATLYNHISYDNGIPVLDVQEYNMLEALPINLVLTSIHMPFSYYSFSTENRPNRRIPSLLYRPAVT